MQMERRPAAPRASRDCSSYTDLSRGCMAKRGLQRERAVVGATYINYMKSSPPNAIEAMRKLFSIHHYRRELQQCRNQSQTREASRSTNHKQARDHLRTANPAFHG